MGVFGRSLDHEGGGTYHTVTIFKQNFNLSTFLSVRTQQESNHLMASKSLHQKLNQAEGRLSNVFYCVCSTQYKVICISRPNGLGKLTNTEIHTPCVYLVGTHKEKQLKKGLFLPFSLVQCTLLVTGEATSECGIFRTLLSGALLRWVGWTLFQVLSLHALLLLLPPQFVP